MPDLDQNSFKALFGKVFKTQSHFCNVHQRLQSAKYKKSYSSSRRTLAQARKRVMEKNEKKRPKTMLMTPIKQLKLVLETWTTGQMWKM